MGTVGLLAIGAVAAVLLGTGFRDNDVSLRASGIWLEHTGVGLAVHAHGATGLVDAKVQVASTDDEADPILGVLGGDFHIEQDAELVYLISADGCEVLRFDEARLNLAKIPADGTVRRVVEGDDCERAAVHADEDTTYLVDEATGRVEVVDPRTLEVLPEGVVELGGPLASSNVVDGRFAAVTADEGDLVVVDREGVTRRGLFAGGTDAEVVVVGEVFAAVGTDGVDTVVALPDEDGLPGRRVEVPGLDRRSVASDQLAGDLWLAGRMGGSPVTVGVDLGDGSLRGPFPAPHDSPTLGGPLAVGDRLVVPIEGNQVTTMGLADGSAGEVWPAEPPPEAFDLLVSAGRVWANSAPGDLALRCDDLGCTEIVKDDPAVETVQVTNPREPDPPKAVTAPGRETSSASTSTTATTVAPAPEAPTTTAQQPVTVTVPPPDATRIAQPPGPVRDLRATPGSGSATLTWLPPLGEGPVTYRIESGSLGGPVEVGGTTFEAGGLANGRPHTFEVRARNANGISSPMQVTVTPTESLVGNPRLDHVDPAGGKVRVDWAWPDGVDSAQLSCRSTNGAITFGSQQVGRGGTPLVVEGAPRDHDVVCDVTTRATATTNVIRPVAKPRVVSHQVAPSGPGTGLLSLSVDLGGATTGTVTFTAAGTSRQVPVNARNHPVDLPAGNVGYEVAVAIPTEAAWGASDPSGASVTIQPRAAGNITGTAVPCCEMTIAWTPPPMAAGSTAGYDVVVTQPLSPTPTGCGYVEGVNSCTLTWDPAELSGPIDVSVTVEAFVNGQPAPIAAGGPFPLSPGGGGGAGPDRLPGPRSLGPRPPAPGHATGAVSGDAAPWATTPLLLAVPTAPAGRRVRRRHAHHPHHHEVP